MQPFLIFVGSSLPLPSSRSHELSSHSSVPSQDQQSLIVPSSEHQLSMDFILKPTQLHFKVKALFQFTAETADELSTHEGDILEIDMTVTRSGSLEWWFATGSNGAGWIPCNFVERI